MYLIIGFVTPFRDICGYALYGLEQFTNSNFFGFGEFKDNIVTHILNLHLKPN